MAILSSILLMNIPNANMYLVLAAILLFVLAVVQSRRKVVKSPGAKVDQKISRWTQSRLFRSMVHKVFKVCDDDNAGRINKTELYAGVLLVHIKLAKYLGPAAAYPPTRAAVDKIFEASDEDNSDDIDEEEFTKIMVILFSQITSRIGAYYACLLLLVPYLISSTLAFLDYIGVDTAVMAFDKGIWDNYAPQILQDLMEKIPESVWDTLPETMVSMFMMFVVIPMAWDYLDSFFQNVAENTSLIKKEEKKD